MMEEAKQKADTLVEAINYINKFEGKIVVVKYGGNAMENEELKEAVLTDISMLSQLGLKIVLVHGGGPEIDAELKKKKIEKKVIDGLRVTDEITMKVVAKSLKKINKDLLKILRKTGAKAKDCTKNLLLTVMMDERLGYVGEVKTVKKDALLRKLEKGIIPVIACMGKDIETGHVTNINGDTAATEVAMALKAEKLTILTNVDGVLKNGELLAHLTLKDVKKYIANGVISEGMIPKVLACVDAVNKGVKKAHLINGTTKRALLIEIFTEKGIGTEIVK
jgi:acetylglutamate kinase